MVIDLLLLYVFNNSKFVRVALSPLPSRTSTMGHAQKIYTISEQVLEKSGDLFDLSVTLLQCIDALVIQHRSFYMQE